MRSLLIPNSEDAGPPQGGYRPTSSAVPSRVTGEDVCSRMCRLVGTTQISGSVSAVLPDCVCTENQDAPLASGVVCCLTQCVRFCLALGKTFTRPMTVMLSFSSERHVRPICGFGGMDTDGLVAVW